MYRIPDRIFCQSILGKDLLNKKTWKGLRPLEVRCTASQCLTKRLSKPVSRLSLLSSLRWLSVFVMTKFWLSFPPLPLEGKLISWKGIRWEFSAWICQELLEISANKLPCKATLNKRHQVPTIIVPCFWWNCQTTDKTNVSNSPYFNGCYNFSTCIQTFYRTYN